MSGTAGVCCTVVVPSVALALLLLLLPLLLAIFAIVALGSFSLGADRADTVRLGCLGSIDADVSSKCCCFRRNGAKKDDVFGNDGSEMRMRDTAMSWDLAERFVVYGKVRLADGCR